MRTFALGILVWVACFAQAGAWAQEAADKPGLQERRFQDAEEWARRFDGASRDSWQKPEAVIRVLGLRSDSIVADIGAGTGYFAARLAPVVPLGKVYAVDVEPEMVRHLRDRARQEGIANMHVIQGDRADPRLPEVVDAVLMVNVQGLMVRPGDYFARLRSRIKPGGRLVIVATRVDSPMGAPAGMRVPPEKVKQDMTDQGYRLIAERDFLPYQFLLVFAPR
jgi:precorrin-6B methylase 2